MWEEKEEEEDLQYMTRRGLAGIQDSVDASIQRLEDYIKSAEEDRIQPSEPILATHTSTGQE